MKDLNNKISITLGLDPDVLYDMVSRWCNEGPKSVDSGNEFESAAILKKVLLYCEKYSERFNSVYPEDFCSDYFSIHNRDVKGYYEYGEDGKKIILIPTAIFESDVAPEYSYKDRIDALENLGKIQCRDYRVKVRRLINGMNIFCISICIDDLIEYVDAA